MTDQQSLRRQLKQARRAVPPDVLALSQRQTLARLSRRPEFRRARRIAAYVGHRGEIDPIPLMADAHGPRKAIYLPILHPFLSGRLWFGRWRPGQTMKKNRFGIPEPRSTATRLLPARQLDLVIVPLLGFDQHGHRLGMGGGYYDRTFAFLRVRKHLRRPLLVGLAHDFQQVDALIPNAWDIDLDVIVTPTQTFLRD